MMTNSRRKNLPHHFLTAGPSTMALILGGLIALQGISGCRPNKRYDLLEAELRTRERELAETRAALEAARRLNEAYGQTRCTVPPAHTAPLSPLIQQITLARGTGGLDEDGLAGDEALMVVLAPQDDDGSVIKVPGRVEVWLWEITTSGQKHFLGSWALTHEQIRPTWRQGFISSGYFLRLPWPRYPQHNKVRIAVRFTTLDGRIFEADRDIHVQPLPVPSAPYAPAPTPPSSQSTPPAQPLLPEPLPPGSPPVEELPPPASSSRDK